MWISKVKYEALQLRLACLEQEVKDKIGEWRFDQQDEVVRNVREDVKAINRLLKELGYVYVDYSKTPSRWVKEETK